MKGDRKTILLGLAIAFQVGVLAIEYLGAQYPLWVGTEIRLAVHPVDPRSLFRGNYARLDYDISRLEASEVPFHDELRSGEVVYVRLKPGQHGRHVYHSVSLAPPPEGPFLRGRLRQRFFARNDHLHIDYGIEAWFAPPDKALAIERQLAAGATAIVRVAPNGKAALQAIVDDTGRTPQ